MHILPLPLCGLYGICAQNGYGQHHPCKIVLLTLGWHPRESPTDTSFMKNTQNTRERPTMKLVELSINKHIVDEIRNHHIINGT